MQTANLQEKPVRVEVYDIKTPKRGEYWGRVKAIVDISITPPGLVIRGFRIMENDQKGIWVSPPYQKLITSTTGEKVYFDLLYFPDPGLWKEIKKVILQAYQVR